MTKTLLKSLVVGCLMIVGFAQAVPVGAQSANFVRNDRILGHDTDVWRVWVPAGRMVRVVVDGQTHTDLDLEVRDAQTGQLLDYDDDETSYCIANFYGPYSRLIEIRIDNLGRYTNAYRLEVRW